MGMTTFEFYFYKYFRWLKHVPFYIPFQGFVFIDFESMKTNYEIQCLILSIKELKNELRNR